MLAYLGTAFSLVTEPLVSKAAAGQMATIGFALSIVSAITNKYMKNRAIVVLLYFSYQHKTKIRYKYERGKRYKVTIKWIKVYDVKKEVNLREKLWYV